MFSNLFVRLLHLHH
uniref:Uncharacterized protein n=1 Tax=Rhizophora mucronata TaxID=61149 RepID=A0A2P2R4G7_RHIMU